jgi:CheY-like chemotaxis protein
VIVNLVLNAAEAIGEADGRITVRTYLAPLTAQTRNDLRGYDTAPGDYVWTEVQDTGSGMDEKTRSRIFDPFFTTKFTGRGLGLAAVGGVVRGHKGVVKLTSSPGEGTTFAVAFPAAVTLPERVNAFETFKQETNGAGGILIVDDEDVLRKTAQLALQQRAGYRVFVAENGRAAIEILESEGPQIDLALLDMSMPDMSGHETLAELQRRKADIKVLLSSGYPEAEAVRLFPG